MCSQRYSESRTIHEETRRGNDQFNAPFSQRVSVPIERSINSFNSTPNEQRVQERIRNHDTSVQWVNDPISGQEKFRVHINIEGFNQNEVCEDKPDLFEEKKTHFISKLGEHPCRWK